MTNPAPAGGAGTHPLVVLGYTNPVDVQYGALAVTALVILYCIATSDRVLGALYRLGICAATAAAGSGIFVLWANHAHHAQLLQGAGQSSLTAELAQAWWVTSAAVALVLFVISTWFAGRRRRGGFQFRRRRATAAPFVPPPGGGGGFR